MEWTKIPTDILQSRFSDKEILAITKYQVLWAMLERQPDEKTCLRYMTSKQYQQALNYELSIKHRVSSDIKSVESHRKRQKLFYDKNQRLMEKTDGHTDAHTDGNDDSHTDKPDKIRLDKKKETEKEKKYVFEGRTIKLNEKDFNAWKEKYNLVDIEYELEQLDCWFQEEKNEGRRKDWFWVVQKSLAKKQKEKYDKLPKGLDGKPIQGYHEW